MILEHELKKFQSNHDPLHGVFYVVQYTNELQSFLIIKVKPQVARYSMSLFAPGSATPSEAFKIETGALYQLTAPP